MNSIEENIREFVCARLSEYADRMNIPIGKINDNFNLFESGVLDSLGFVELMSSVEDKFDIEFDFEELDPSTFATLSGFINCALRKRGDSVE